VAKRWITDMFTDAAIGDARSDGIDATNDFMTGYDRDTRI
jgi:hypothetical protein